MSSEPRHVRTTANAAATDAPFDVNNVSAEEVVRMSSEPRHVRTTANAAATDALFDVNDVISEEVAA